MRTLPMAALIAAFFVSAPAPAGPPMEVRVVAFRSLCGGPDAVVEILEKGRGERRSSVATTERGQLMELFRSTAGAWSLVFTAPGAPACIIAGGDDWERLAAPPAGEPA